jgi:hypothetical protein
MGNSSNNFRRSRTLIAAPVLGVALALLAVTFTVARPAAQASPRQVAPAQATQAIVTTTGTLLDGDGVCGANWKIRRCGDGVLVPVRSDMNIQAHRGTFVQVDGISINCSQTGKTYLWLSGIGSVTDCAPPTPTPSPMPTPRPGPNLALNHPVTASAGDPGSPPELAVDGDPATAWHAFDTSAWIWVDLGQDRTFNRMKLMWGEPHAVRYGIFVLEPNAAGKPEWMFKYEVDQSDGGQDGFNVPRLYGRYVLLYAVESSDTAGGFVLNEWEIFGQETANLAFGQRVDVLDAQACCPGYLAIDSRYETGWQSEVRPALQPGVPTPLPPARNPWLRLFLPPGSSVVELRTFWDHMAYPWYYRIVFYEGNSTRTLQVRSQRGGQHLISWPLPVKADAVLVYTDVLPATVHYVALSEMEVFGPAEMIGPNPTPTPTFGLRLAPPQSQGVSWQWLPDSGSKGRIGPPGPIEPLGAARMQLHQGPTFPRPDAAVPAGALLDR